MADDDSANKPVFPLTFTLRKPIEDKDAKPVSTIVLREPTAGDISAAGNPVRMQVTKDGGIEFVHEEAKMSAMIARLADIPPSFIAKMDARDWNTLAFRISSFFIPDLVG